MASWREEFVQNLKDRDEREKASYQRIDTDFISAYTDLLDRTAALEAEKTAYIATRGDTESRASTATTASDATAQIRSDLAEALRSNGQLQSRIKLAEAELVKLRTKSKADTQSIEDLIKERAYLSQKLRDKDEELRGKTKLLDDVHDETISLDLQLNMAEQKVKTLQAENKDLIDRWMARKGREAEEMNRTLQHEK